MKQIIGMACVIVTVVAIIGNATLMLISPRTWFRLPRGVRLSGNLSKTKYGSGWGAIQIRVLGAGSLGGMIWLLHDCVAGRLTR